MARSVGRPPLYTGAVARHIVSLALRHNATVARKILNASGRSKLVGSRNQKLVPHALGISAPTILKLVGLAGKELPKGRPSKAA